MYYPPPPPPPPRLLPDWCRILVAVIVGVWCILMTVAMAGLLYVMVGLLSALAELGRAFHS